MRKLMRQQALPLGGGWLVLPAGKIDPRTVGESSSANRFGLVPDMDTHLGKRLFEDPFHLRLEGGGQRLTAG